MPLSNFALEALTSQFRPMPLGGAFTKGGNPILRRFHPSEPQGGSVSGAGLSAGRDPLAPLPEPSIADPLPQIQPIATQAILGNLAPEKKRETGLFKGNDLAAVAGILSDALMAYGGLQPQFAPRIARQEEQEAERNFALEKLNAELEAKRQERLHPQLEQVGNTLGMFDPGAASFNPIFTAPQPWELYAKALGHEPGTDGYRQAIEDYRAGTWGDEGVAGRLAVQAPRLAVSRENNIRSTSTSRDNNIRSTGTSRDNSIRSTSQSNRNSQRAAETARGAHSYRFGGSRGGRRGGDGPVAVGSNGQRLVVRNGRWVDEATGRPVQ